MKTIGAIPYLSNSNKQKFPSSKESFELGNTITIN